MTFNEGDEVFLVSGMSVRDTVEKARVSRVTSTLAIVEMNGRERKFDREWGNQKPRPTGYSRGDRIEHPSPTMERRYLENQRRELARRLSFAATQYERGDDTQAGAIAKLYAAWSKIAAVSEGVAPVSGGGTVNARWHRQLLAQGWDAAAAAMRYEDGTPVEIVSMMNPYREQTPVPEVRAQEEGEK